VSCSKFRRGTITLACAVDASSYALCSHTSEPFEVMRIMCTPQCKLRAFARCPPNPHSSSRKRATPSRLGSDRSPIATWHRLSGARLRHPKAPNRRRGSARHAIAGLHHLRTSLNCCFNVLERRGRQQGTAILPTPRLSFAYARGLRLAKEEFAEPITLLGSKATSRGLTPDLPVCRPSWSRTCDVFRL